MSGPTTLQWRNRSQAFIGTNPATAQVRTGARKTSGCAVTQDTPEREHDKFAPLERLRVIGFLRERSTSQEESKAPSACSGSFPPLGRTDPIRLKGAGFGSTGLSAARLARRGSASDFERETSAVAYLPRVWAPTAIRHVRIFRPQIRRQGASSQPRSWMRSRIA